MALIIEGWERDDGNLNELGAHGLERRTVLQVAEERPRFRKNRRGRAASHQMIGPDHGGSMWTVCIAPSSPTRPTLWRAITGWASEDHEIDWYRRNE